MRYLLVAFGLLAGAAHAEGGADPDWPCIQRKQPHLSLGQMWTGPEPDPAARDLAQGGMAFLNRQTYSFPPFHGAKIVATVLNTPELRAEWIAELEEVRGGMLRLRKQLADELAQLSGSDRFAFIAEHRGMFSRLGASPEVVQKIKDEFAIYMVGDSRLNIAGLNDTTVPILARAIIEAGI